MKISTLIKKIEETPITARGFPMAFFTLIILRLTIEMALGGFHAENFETLFFEFSHTFLFFLFAFLLFLPLLSFFTKSTLSATSRLLLFGFLVILTPPIIDTLIFGQNGFWSFYEFDGLQGLLIRYFTLFGDSPDIGITYGVRLEVVLMTLLSGYLIWIKTKHFFRSLIGALACYTLFFILGTFPSWITLLLHFPTLPDVTANDVAALFLTPEPILGRDITNLRSVLNIKMSLWYALLNLAVIACLLYIQKPKDWVALYRNARFPQVFYHGGLICIGVLLALHFETLTLPQTHFALLALILLLWSAVFAWLTSVIINDIHDQAIDTKTNHTRPLITKTISLTHYEEYALFFFLTSLFFAGLVSPQALLLVFGYQVVAWAYSVPPFRLKRFPLIATLTAALASFLLLAAGYLSVSEAKELLLPPRLIFYLIAALACIIPIKDFKDIAGDKSDHVYTLPVLLGEVGAKRVLGSILFIVFSLSPLVFNSPSLTLPALVFGSLAFWMVQRGTKNQKSFFAYQRFSLLIFSLAFIYGLFVFTTFL